MARYFRMVCCFVLTRFRFLVFSVLMARFLFLVFHPHPARCMLVDCLHAVARLAMLGF